MWKTAAIALTLLLAASLGVGCMEKSRHDKTRVVLAETRAEFSAYRASQAEAGRHAEKAERQKERNREDDIRQAVAAERAAGALDRAAAAAAVAAGGKLRDALDIAVRTIRACPRSNPPGGGKTTDAAADLLQRVQQRLDEAADGIAEFADSSRRAGLTCERIHDRLSGAATTP